MNYKFPLCLGGGLLVAALAIGAVKEAQADVSPGAQQSLSMAKGLQNAFADVADKSIPSIVIIKAKGLQNAQDRTRRILPPWIQLPDRPQEETLGMGSGFIIRDDGYIVTNHHVAGTASELRVLLHDGREVTARRIGTDWKTDLSVLKIDVKDKLPTLKFADSDKVKVGHWAIAIGAPYSLGYTMTTGIVSQKGRAVGLNQYEDYIQTDAAINPGNSGGPLLNIDGEVIGINDFIVSGGGGQGDPSPASGLAFAIPSNLASSVALSIIKNGEVVRPWIGVSMQDLDQNSKQQLKAVSGVLIKGVFSGDPADKAGIEPGDIVTKINGKPVASTKELMFGILKYQPGEAIPLTVMREGEEKDVKVLAGRQRSDTMAGVDNDDGSAKAVRKAGAFSAFGMELGESGGRVIIESIEPDSPAALSGLREGMSVYAVNRRKVASVHEAEQAAAKGANPRKLLLYVEDGLSRYFVALQR